MSESGWEALPDIVVRSGGPPGCPGGFGRPSRMSCSGLETLLDVWKALPDVWKVLSYVRVWAGGPPGRSRVVGRPSRMSGSGWEALPYVWEAPQDVR